MVSLDLLVVLAGVIYGYVRPGKEDKMKILKNGLTIGLMLGIALGIIGLLIGRSLSAIAVGMFGIAALLIVALVLTVAFIIGVFVGDFLEGVLKK